MHFPRALAPSHRAARTLLVLLAALSLVLGVSVSLARPARAAVASFMTYQGVSASNARIPATTVTLATVTPVAHDRGTYTVSGVARGAITSVVAGGGLYTGTGPVDLTGMSGPVLVVAKLYAGKQVVQTVSKWVRAVPLVTSGVPAGFPNAATTGVPAGTVLTPSTDLDIWEAGAVLEGLDVRGCLTVHARGVVVRDSRITCTDDTLRAVSLIDAPGFVMEDSEIVSDGSAEVAIGWSGYTLRRVEVRGTQDGPRLGDDVTLVDSYVHDLVRHAAVHADGAQSTSGDDVVVRHNTFDPRQQGSGDFLNSAIQLGTETGSKRLRNVLFEGNFFNGGNYSVNISCKARMAGVVFRDNSFGHGNRYGAVIAPAGATWSGNRWIDTGTVVPVAPAC